MASVDVNGPERILGQAGWMPSPVTGGPHPPPLPVRSYPLRTRPACVRSGSAAGVALDDDVAQADVTDPTTNATMIMAASSRPDRRVDRPDLQATGP